MLKAIFDEQQPCMPKNDCKTKKEIKQIQVKLERTEANFRAVTAGKLFYKNQRITNGPWLMAIMHPTIHFIHSLHNANQCDPACTCSSDNS